MQQKLVLIIPPTPWLISDTDVPMLGILYVASYVKSRGYAVEVCDLSGISEDAWQIPIGTIYGVTGTSPQLIYMQRIVELIKARQPEALVVVGGVHATTSPFNSLLYTRADICVVGEGEFAMVEILEGRRDEFIRAPRIEDLDVLPFPDRESINYERYVKVATFKYLIGECREVAMMTARGCPYACAFCASPLLWGRRVREHSVPYVRRELEFLKARYEANLVTFSDDTFTLNRQRVIEMSKVLRELEMFWHCLARVDCPEDLYKIMADNGCVQVTFGFESGSNRVLEFINKKATVEKAYKAIAAAHKAGLKIRGQIVVGLPGETDASIKETAEFIRNSASVAKFGLHIFQPVPGCAVALDPKKYNYEIKRKADFSDYHTIGKPGELSTTDPQVVSWYQYLRFITGGKHIDVTVRD